MEEVYQFKLDQYIHYYDYNLCDEKSDDDEDISHDLGTEEEKATREFTD